VPAMAFAILGISWLQKWGFYFATLSIFIMQKTPQNKGKWVILWKIFSIIFYEGLLRRMEEL
jgi:hypothetical protein